MEPFRFGTGRAFERFAYVGLAAENARQSDSIGVVDTAPDSAAFGQVVGRVELPHGPRPLLRFGWNVCGPRGCRYASRPSERRRYLVVPGTTTSRIHVVDTQPDPKAPRLVTAIDDADEMHRRGYCPPQHFAHDITDISLSADDQSLWVSCWGTGELRRYDVADRFNPVLAGVARSGGFVRRTAHPATPNVRATAGRR